MREVPPAAHCDLWPGIQILFICARAGDWCSCCAASKYPNWKCLIPRVHPSARWLNVSPCARRPPGQLWWIPAADAAEPLNEESSFPIRSAVWQEAMFDLRVLSSHRWLVWFSCAAQTGSRRTTFSNPPRRNKWKICHGCNSNVRCLQCHQKLLELHYRLLKMITQNHFVMAFFSLSGSQLYWLMQVNLLVFTHNACVVVQIPHVVLAKQCGPALQLVESHYSLATLRLQANVPQICSHIWPSDLLKTFWTAQFRCLYLFLLDPAYFHMCS